MPFVSIIIPIFNSEKTLGRCLDSLFHQSYENWEAILINDGSSDSSETICKEYTNKDSRFSYFAKDNGGVSSARNMGIKKSQGVYLMFLDSDDYIEPDYLEGFLPFIDEGVDILQGGYKMITNTIVCKYVKDKVLIDLNKQSDIDFLQKNCPDNGVNYPWGKFIKAELIKKNQIIFNEKMKLSEDLCFVLECLSYTNNLLLVPVNGMNYFYGGNMSSKYSMDFETYKSHCNYQLFSIRSFERKHNVELKTLRESIISFFYCFLSYFNSIEDVSSKCRIMGKMRDYDKGSTLKLISQKVKTRGRIYYYSLYYCPFITPFLLKIGLAKV